MPENEYKKRFLLIDEKAGPITSFPIGVNLLFKRIQEFNLYLKNEKSFFFCSFLVNITILFNFDFFKTKEFNLTFFTDIFINEPKIENFLKKPPYK